MGAPPCTPVSLTGCRRRSPPWLPPPSRSRSSLPLRGSTPSGSEDPSWPPSPPSSRCGSPSRRTTSAAPPSSTGSASKRFSTFVQRIHSFDISIRSHSTKHNFNKYTQYFVPYPIYLIGDNVHHDEEQRIIVRK